MFVAIVRHSVKEFAAWKQLFDKHEGRIKAGFSDTRVYTAVDDPDDVAIVIEFDDLDKGMAFLNSDDLKQAMQDGGVTEQPTLFLGNRE